MGIIRNGILGGFSNKTGPLVGVVRKKLNIIKSLPVKTKKPPTPSQLLQRRKMSLVSSFLSEISELTDMGFTTLRGISDAWNAAIAYNLKHGIKYDGLDLTFDYTKLSFSRGKLALPENTAIEALADHSVEFSWIYDGTENYDRTPGDQCTVLVYNPEKHRFVYQINAALRVDKFYVLQLPESFTGDIVYCYLSLISIKNKRLVSPSTYIGQTVVI